MFDHSVKPPIIPPETKKADLYKSPEVFKKLDERAIEVSFVKKIDKYLSFYVSDSIVVT